MIGKVKKTESQLSNYFLKKENLYLCTSIEFVAAITH